MERGLCNQAWNTYEITSTFPHSNSLLPTREMANDSPTCVILALCPEKQYNLVSMTERQLAEDLLYRVHKLACKSAPRCPRFPSLLQNTYFAENCCFPFPRSREDCISPREQGLIIFYGFNISISLLSLVGTAFTKPNNTQLYFLCKIWIGDRGIYFRRCLQNPGEL